MILLITGWFDETDRYGHKTGKKLFLTSHGIDLDDNDKIDPSKGYTKDNCRVVCWWYNLAKSIYSDEVVLDLMKTTVKFIERNNG